MEGLATDNVISEVKYSRQANLLISWHLVQMKPVQDAGFNLPSRLLRLCFVKERIWCIHKRAHERGALLVSQNAAIHQAINQLAGNALVHEEARRIARTARIDHLTYQARQRLRHVVARGQVGYVVGCQRHDGVHTQAFLEVTQDRFVHLIQALVLEYQTTAAVKQTGRVTQATQSRTIDGSRGESVDLDLGSQVPRQDLGQDPLARFGDRIVTPVGVGHCDVLLTTEVARYVQNGAFALVLHHRTELADQ